MGVGLCGCSTRLAVLAPCSRVAHSVLVSARARTRMASIRALVRDPAADAFAYVHLVVLACCSLPARGCTRTHTQGVHQGARARPRRSHFCVHARAVLTNSLHARGCTRTRRASIKALVRDPAAAAAAYGPYVKALACDVGDARALRRALRGAGSVVCLGKLGALPQVRPRRWCWCPKCRSVALAMTTHPALMSALARARGGALRRWAAALSVVG